MGEGPFDLQGKGRDWGKEGKEERGRGGVDRTALGRKATDEALMPQIFCLAATLNDKGPFALCGKMAAGF
ncbi:hypothetical protein CLOM_g23622 [Closterium sp. NIES-68]|nr:hypothetical protein CLOM_g23622 [Closterium sp. NIES-68]